MQTVQIRDKADLEFQNLARQEHASTSDLIERLIAKHIQELAERL